MEKTQNSVQPEAARFDQLGLNAELLRAITDLEFTTPTPIQQKAIPAALTGRDVLGAAATGSGKTAAFVLPILQNIMSKPRGTTRALVLAPTRELAAQIVEHTNALSKHTRVRAAAIYGGVGMKPQEDAIRRGIDILVATPGRLLDHCQRGYVNFTGIEILVLDEADRMLDMGFLPDIRRVLRHLPKTPRQTLFFSATMPQPIVQLSGEMLKNPATLNIERKQAPATGVTQALYPVAQDLKVALFVELLKRDEIGNVIVFCRTKHRANRLADQLEKRGIPAAKIHGNRSQNQRTEALAGFKSGRFRVLVATDIVARGIDVEALDHVVNFDVPNLPEDYIHRVGRTARAEATGDAFTFVSPEEESDLRAIERAIGRKLPRRTVDGFDYTARPREQFEVPLAERIAAIRARKSEERARARAKADRKAQLQSEEETRAAAKRARPARREPAGVGGGSVGSGSAGGRRPTGPRPNGGRSGNR